LSCIPPAYVRCSHIANIIEDKGLTTLSDDPYQAASPDLGEELLKDFYHEGLGGDLPVGEPKIVGPDHRTRARTVNAG
jgi:hypothetical protein